MTTILYFLIAIMLITTVSLYHIYYKADNKILKILMSCILVGPLGQVKERTKFDALLLLEKITPEEGTRFFKFLDKWLIYLILQIIALILIAIAGFLLPSENIATYVTIYIMVLSTFIIDMIAKRIVHNSLVRSDSNAEKLNIKLFNRVQLSYTIAKSFLYIGILILIRANL